MGKARLQFTRMVRAIVLGAVSLGVALGPAAVSLPSAAQGKRSLPEEHQLKAAFVFNLLSFVDWPPGTVQERLVVGFAGEGPMEAALRRLLKDERLGATAIEFRLAQGRNELRACNVLYLAYPDEARMREALSQLEGQSVLTIGDGEEFVRMGGMVGFFAQENKLRLLVNPGAAQRARLRISSKLLKIATPLADEESGRD